MLILTIFAISRWPNLMPLNFSLAYAIVFCAGAFPKWIPPFAAFGVLVLTDIIKNVVYYKTDAISDYTLVNYGAFALIYFLGRQFRKTSSIWKHAGGGLLGAFVFYFITNTGAWLQNPEYSKTLAGWIQALTVGTSGWPQTWEFFRNTLLSGGLFSGLLAAVIQTYAKDPETEPASEDEATETEAEPGHSDETVKNPQSS